MARPFPPRCRWRTTWVQLTGLRVNGLEATILDRAMDTAIVGAITISSHAPSPAHPSGRDRPVPSLARQIRAARDAAPCDLLAFQLKAAGISFDREWRISPLR